MMYNYLAEATVGLEYQGVQNETGIRYIDINDQSSASSINVKNMLDYYQDSLSQKRLADPSNYSIKLVCPPHQGCYPISSIRLYQVSSFIETFDLVRHPDYSDSYS